MRYLAITLFVVMLIFPALGSALDIKDEELMLYLPFDAEEGDGANDYSIHENHGVLVGDIEVVEGKHGQAFQFDASAEVKSPYIELDERSFTICMWIKPALEGAAEQCVFSQMQANATNTSMHYRIYTNATVRMGFYSNDLDAPAAVAADEWAHIAFWLDVDVEEKRRIYINGEQVVEDAGKSGLPYLGTSGDTIIGSWGTSGQRFNGVIDEVQLWHRALSEQEIQESMEYLIAFPVEANGKLATTWSELKR